MRLSRNELINRLVEEIEQEPFTCYYRRNPFGQKVEGWTRRLESYFWPRPECGFKDAVRETEAFTLRGAEIVQAKRPWNQKTRKLAEEFAQSIFYWGGVPQRNFSADQVFAVMLKALDDGASGKHLLTAPLNSGWTKVAAFLTAHLEQQNHSQIIWDSRVSWSLVQRIDGLIPDGNQSLINERFSGIGKVPGRGGTRWKKQLRFAWPNAYANWSSQFAASKLAREIRDNLNNRGFAAIDEEGNSCPWTIRSVEMVLFMDGY